MNAFPPYRVLIAAISAVLACLALAACGGGTDSGGGASAASSGGGGTTGSSLVELDTDIAPSLEPDSPSGDDPGFEQAFVNLAEPLVSAPTKEVDGVLVPNYQVSPTAFKPDLATSYSQKGLTWTFHLRQGVMSCYGNELTAQDVVYTFARAKALQGTASDSYFVATVGGVFDGKGLEPGATAADKVLDSTEVKATGKYTVQITQKHSDALFPAILSIWSLAPWDEVEMKKVATASDQYAHHFTETTGAPTFGPYCLSSWKKGASMTFTANKGWFRGAPQYSKITMEQVPSDSQRVAGLLSGQANIATELTPLETQKVAQTSSTDTLSWDNPGNMVTLGINYADGPFTDPTKGKLIREAIAYAMPYDGIKSGVYDGQFQTNPGLFSTDDVGFKPVSTYENTDLAKAKALLAQAGYPGGKGLVAGPAFKLSYAAERSSVLQPMATMIATALKGIGIPITLNPIPASQLETDLVQSSLGMYIQDESRPLLPDVGYATLLYFVNKKDGGLSDSTNYDSATVNKLYAQSATATGAARTKLLGEIQETADNDLSSVAIGIPRSELAVTKGITGWLGNIYDLVYWDYLKS
jgi:peptide/nickel transport system substrate-binding protein